LPTKKRDDRHRYTLVAPEKPVAVLGYDRADPNVRITQAVTVACHTAARLVAHATRELEGILARNEWNAIADVMND
jgi:hypothetical protein